MTCFECGFVLAGISSHSTTIKTPVGKDKVTQHDCPNCGAQFVERIEQTKGPSKKDFEKNIPNK